MDDDTGSTDRPAARWRVRLKGEALDLEDLVETHLRGRQRAELRRAQVLQEPGSTPGRGG